MHLSECKLFVRKIAYFKQLPEAANTVCNNASVAVKMQMLMRTYPLCMTDVY